MLKPPTTKRSLGLLLVAPMMLFGCYEGLNSDKDNPGQDTDGDDGGDGPPGGPDSDGNAPLDGPGECEDTKKYFEQDVHNPILLATCFSCHSPQGAAKETDLVLQGNDYPGYVEANYNTVANIAQLEIDGVSLLLLKPSKDGVEHGGGVQMRQDSDEYAIMEEMVRKFKAPSHCVNDEEIEEYFTGVVELDEEETLRKAVTVLASRLPTQEEYDRVRGNGMEAVEEVLDEVMTEDAFIDRVKEMFNDVFHLRAYLPGSEAVDTYSTDQYPELYWYQNLPEEEQDQNRDWTNEGLATAGEHLLEKLVREDRKFGEILTADYQFVNPYAARSLSIPLSLFEDANDPNEYIEFNNEDIPEAGIVSLTTFLHRYPSTDTNRNRHRSRILNKFFLATDVLKLAARPIDIVSVAAFNPTLNEPQCNTCHNYIDPLAGAFQNWTNEGWYEPPATGWYGDMVPPGFKDELMPFEDAAHALQWTTERVVNDTGFSMAMVHTIFKGLTGSDALAEPLDANDPIYVQRIKAFEAQDWSFKKIAKRFEDSDQNIKEVFKGVVTSTWFRAYDLETIPGKKRQAELDPMGTARLIPPEIMHHKVIATMGFPWQRNDNDLLLNPNEYLFFLGGIKSDEVTTRLTEMNGVMANIVDRMANELGCYATSNDFVKAKADRLLFPEVDMTDTPDNGGADKIRANIEYLHKHLLAEFKLDQSEIDRTEALFMAVWRDGFDGTNPPEGEQADYSVQLPGQCQALTDRLTGDAIPAGQQIIDDPDYTARAWMAVITYLTGDYRFWNL